MKIIIKIIIKYNTKGRKPKTVIYKFVLLCPHGMISKHDVFNTTRKSRRSVGSLYEMRDSG